MPNHEDVGCSEHQIRLSKGVIAKFVQSLELEVHFCALSNDDKRKSHRNGGVSRLSYVTETVSIFRIPK